MNAGKKVKKDGMRVALFGAESHVLTPEIARHAGLRLVTRAPEVVVCYGGDGTLLAAELKWPGLPKVPILNSKVGHHCIRHRPREVITALARQTFTVNTYNKLECAIHRAGKSAPDRVVTPLNEIVVSKGRVNTAMRWQLWVDGTPYENGVEIIGDGLVVCTPFGSTAYFRNITRGVFVKGIGVAFIAVSQQQVNHLVLPSDSVARVLITRGPALLAYDCAAEDIVLHTGDELVCRKHPHGATILTCGLVRTLNEPF